MHLCYFAVVWDRSNPIPPHTPVNLTVLNCSMWKRPDQTRPDQMKMKMKMKRFVLWTLFFFSSSFFFGGRGVRFFGQCPKVNVSKLLMSSLRCNSWHHILAEMKERSWKFFDATEKGRHWRQCQLPLLGSNNRPEIFSVAFPSRS